MWIIEDKPTLRKALNDAKKTVDHCRNLDAVDLAKLEDLYRTYDKTGGRLDLVDLAPLESKKDIIKQQYGKTYGKDVLSNIRRDLFLDVERCPMCSILRVTDLDHFWNESKYGQLAVCRLNLIPTCGRCNKSKTNDNPNHFIQAYYQHFPAGVVFLKCDCKIVSGYVVPKFYIDGTGLGDKTLGNRLKSQMAGIKLKQRLRSASKGFLLELFQGTTFKTERAMRNFLVASEKDKGNIFGLNDWRTALVRGLIACHGFDMSVVMTYRHSTKRTRDGRV